MFTRSGADGDCETIMIGISTDESTVSLILKSFPCSWGKCTFCSFHLESSQDVNDIIKTNKGIIEKGKRIRVANRELCILNGGSIFELPLRTVLDLGLITRGKRIRIETRPEFLDSAAVNGIRKMFKPKDISIAVGFESFDDTIRNRVLKKGIPQKEIRRVRSLAEDQRFRPMTYVLFGMTGIPEESVIESVSRFSDLGYDVRAIRYRKNRALLPEPKRPSKGLLRFLNQSCTVEIV